MSFSIQKTGNDRGLVYTGRSSSYSPDKVQKVERIHNIQSVKDDEFKRKYDLYMKGANKMSNSVRDFRDAQADQIILMDAELQVESSTPPIARLQKRVLELDRATESMRKLVADIPEISALCASTTRSIEAMKSKALVKIDKLAQKETHEDAKRNIPVKCDQCGEFNYLTRKEFLSSSPKSCTNCHMPL